MLQRPPLYLLPLLMSADRRLHFILGRKGIHQRSYLQVRVQFIERRLAHDPDLLRLSGDEIDVVIQELDLEISKRSVDAARQHLR